MRRGLFIVWMLIVFTGISSLFWYNEWVYSLPTPVPAKLIAKPIGEEVDISGYFRTGTDKPVFLHFFNPVCPCSRFNIPHVRSLVKQYGDKVDFAIVVMSSDPNSVEEIQNRFNLNLPVLFDTTLAISCGVYSTPQAVILDKHRKLFYRGNYNKSRYCTDVTSNYAQIALDSLLAHSLSPDFSPFALTAYGCQLPNCRK